MTPRIATIARYTVLEAVRTRLPLLTFACIAVLLALSFFVREIAIAESARFQTVFYAATVRFAIVFIAALYAIASIAREFQDKGLDAMLALDLPRSHYIFGKLAGFGVIAVVLAIAAALPLAPLAGVQAVAAWTASLALEIAVVVAFSVFCAVTFNQLMPAMSVVMAFYLVARALTAMRLIGANPVGGGDALSHQTMTWLVEGIAHVVPALDEWTRTAWLVDGAAAGPALSRIVVHAVLFIALVAAAAVFDMHRKNF